MTRVQRTFIALALASLAASCAVRPAPPEPVQPPAPQHIAQLGFGDTSHYGVCLEPACPKVTPKTMAAEAAPPATDAAPSDAPASAPAPAALPEFKPAPAALLHTTTQELAIEFMPGTTSLTREARAAIDRALPIARAAQSISIYAHSSGSSRSAQTSKRLAIARAQAVRQQLHRRAPELKQGVIVIDASAVPTETRDGRSVDSRVDVVFTLRG